MYPIRRITKNDLIYFLTRNQMWYHSCERRTAFEPYHALRNERLYEKIFRKSYKYAR